MAQGTRANSKGKNGNGNGSTLGFEATLWATADKLRGNLDAAEYKHVVLGLIFLKYISDAFEERHAKLLAEKGANPEDRDEYLADNIFWVPQEARWSFIQGRAASGEVEMDQNHRSGIGSYSLAFSSKDSLKSFLPSSPN